MINFKNNAYWKIDLYEKYISDNKIIDKLINYLPYFSNYEFELYYQKYLKMFYKKNYNCDTSVINEYLQDKKENITKHLKLYKKNKNLTLIIEYLLPNILIYYEQIKKNNLDFDSELNMNILKYL